MTDAEDVRQREEEDAWNLSRIHQKPSRLRAKRMSQIMSRLMARRGYGQVEAAGQLAELWQEIAGEQIAVFARPGHIYRGKLIVTVSDSSALQRLHFEETRIVRELKRRAPELKIRGLDIRLS